jgi:hypothetical protein
MDRAITLERVDRALAAVTEETPLDGVALLWITRSELVGVPLVPENLCHLMGLSLDEAEDVFARLAEHGLIEQG